MTRPLRHPPALSRRRFLGWATRLGMLATGLALGSRLAAGAHAQARRYEGRLIDAHGHLYGDEYADYHGLMRLYDAADMAGCWLFGFPWTVATDAWLAYPGRVVPFLGEGYSTALHPYSSYVNPEGLDGLLAGGYVRGLGEMILRHSPFQLGSVGGGASAPANHVPADEPRLLETYRIAGRHGAPVTVHQESSFSQELERALSAAPATAFVWAHAGHGPPGLVGDLMERYPNLHADLSARTPWIGPGTVLLRPDGEMDPTWRAVLERFPDRFLVGLDLFAPAHYQAGYVRMMAEYYRGLLGLLPAEVAQMVAHGNAERLAPFRPIEGG